MIRDFVPRSPLQIAAFFWGVACFLPVGMSYLAAVLLMAALFVTLIQDTRHRQERWQQVRQHPVFWPLCFFMAWTVFILCVQPHYAETGSNLFHGFRIALTIFLVLLLRQAELRVALAGVVLSAIFAVAIIYLNRWIALPMVPGLRNLIDHHGNKSIGIAVLLAIFSVCCFFYALKHFQKKWARLAFIPLFLVVPILIWLLPSRTSLLLTAISLSLGWIHYFWKKPQWLASGIVALVLSGSAVSQITALEKLFSRGAAELHSASESHDVYADPSEASWAVRHMLYTQTSNMIVEKPIFGWGIGAWNDQWRARTPAKIHYVNMPHNDFLWAGSQAGVLGVLSLIAIITSLFVGLLRRRTLAATCSIVTSTGMIIAMSFNSALRDAQIGLTLLFVVMVINAWARADGDT